MRQLLAFEYRKLVRSKALYICLIVMAVLSVAGVIITRSTMNMLNSFGGMYDDDLMGAGGFFSGYSGMRYLVSSCKGTNMTIFFAIFVTIFICADFTEGTIKNIVARGFSREKVFFAKSIVICSGSVVFSILSMLVGFIAGTIAFEAGSGFDGGVVVTLLVQLLAMIAYTMMNVLLGVLFGKLGGALTLGIIIPLVYPLLIQLLDLLIVVLSKNYDVRSDFFSRFTVGSNIDKISELDVPGNDLLIAAVIFAVYILFFTLLGVLAIRKKEV